MILFIAGVFVGGFLGFFVAALLAMSGNILRDEEIDALRRKEPDR